MGIGGIGNGEGGLGRWTGEVDWGGGLGRRTREEDWGMGEGKEGREGGRGEEEGGGVGRTGDPQDQDFQDQDP